ncbi:MAG TPA: GH92 family glycosyl hydrolase [Bryobacteraceae bacterium]|nr:GH92 family glycosyl hydrolase [Bryobacteraceae bacterium]
MNTLWNRWASAFAGCALLFALSGRAADTSAYESVNPFVGTSNDGNTFPGATLPLGMMQWGPDTRDDGWYRYEDHTIRGFSLTHISGAGCPIYADVPVLPWIGTPGADPTGAVLAFSHKNERAQPGYYEVQFDSGVKAELAVTMRAGIGRFSFPAGAERTLLLKAGDSAMAHDKERTADSSTVEIRGDNTVTGVVHSGGFCFVPGDYVLYFAARFAEPFSSFGTWANGVRTGERNASGHLSGAYVTFPAGTKPILMKVGVSFVSVENAIANLDAEIPHWDFDQVRVAAGAVWSRTLDGVRVDGGTPVDRARFYTGLYHMLLAPNTFSDVNGDYVGFDGKVRRLKAGEEQYANFSDWDTYRSLVQLQSLLMPRQESQMMQSLVRDAEQSGWLPKWPVANDVSYVMGGDSPSILISDAYAFGARDFDTATALRFMIKGATVPGTGPHGNSERPWLKDYLSKGYVPVDGKGQEIGASVTLEYASSDFATSQFARALGDREHADTLLRSAQNWRKLFDPESTFIRPRGIDGDFVPGWDPDRLLPKPKFRWEGEQIGFEEGNTWHYTFMIPHNYGGLLAAMGGPEKALPRLDKFFSKLSGLGGPNYTVQNEPDFCAPYVYMWTGHPWKTQEVIDRIRREQFNTKPDGLPGNDDLGATSGVYVWNALGMYPVIPGTAGLVLGTPLFPRAVMHLDDGRMLEIRRSGEGIYVQSVKVNGKPYGSAWLPLDKLGARENHIDFVLGAKPSDWAAQPADYPPSFDVKER